MKTIIMTARCSSKTVRRATLGIISTLAFLLVFFNATAQRKSIKIDDVFFVYVSRTLKFTPEESVRMRPLVKNYLLERKQITSKMPDPLDREQRILNLKKNSRQQMTEVIGIERANRFFDADVTFRRKVRDELQRRKKSNKKIDG